MQGEIDLMDQYIATPNNKSVLYDARQQGGYDFYTLTSTEANVMNFIFNLNHNDETKRKLFRNKDFRAALSTSLDRQTLIDAVLVGQGAPAQPSIKQGDPLYNEQLATQFTAYDVDKANAMLDQIVPKRDDQNFRLDEKGRRLTIIFEIDQARPIFLDLFQLVIPMFQAVGIDAQMRTMDRRSGKPASARAAISMRRPTSSAPTAASLPCSIRATTCRPIRQRHVCPGLAALVSRPQQRQCRGTAGRARRSSLRFTTS
jgi:peptide/nickel transport system substrate-binding protein